MSKLVEIERDITIRVEAGPFLFNYVAWSWALSVVVAVLILTVMGLMDTVVSKAIVDMLFIAIIIEMLLIVALLELIRRKLRRDADEIVDSIKRAVEEVEA